MYYTALHCTALHCTALNCYVLHCTALYYTVLHILVPQVKRLTDSFRARDREARGQALIGYEDFLGLAMGVHQ